MGRESQGVYMEGRGVRACGPVVGSQTTLPNDTKNGAWQGSEKGPAPHPPPPC